MFRWLTEKVVAYLNKKRDSAEQLEIDIKDKGINVTSIAHKKPLSQYCIPWAEINTIIVYKKDLYTSDLICMYIASTNDRVLEIDETTRGWENLVENLTHYLPTASTFEDWFLEVAFPAFETNPVIIYSRN